MQNKNWKDAPLSNEWKDYNTERRHMSMPEYGRNIQKMVLSLLDIPDRQKRNQQAYAVIATMGNLFPHLKNIDDFKHKLWDHLFIISEFRLDIDSPYPKPSPITFETKPEPVPYLNPDDIQYKHYGRCVQNMVKFAATLPEGETRSRITTTMSNHMKRTYLAWNKDVVSDDIIFNDIATLSKGKIKIDAATRLSVGNYTPSVNNSNSNGSPNNRRSNSNTNGSNGGSINNNNARRQRKPQ
ncbi:hypothetical protein FACS189452_03350 [Bacteroidia bacterium]|nr:hypothetical protein FACS189452_03350 [Bacteroidia bacterium]GHT80245.1 hypothetical protein FACS189467_1970 [Bacteroidia bacterium]